MQTQLHRPINPNFYGYQDAPWRIFLRKEVPGQTQAEPGEGQNAGRRSPKKPLGRAQENGVGRATARGGVSNRGGAGVEQGCV